MGWVVDVVVPEGAHAQCRENMAVWPLPPGTEGPDPARCGWTGPIRGTAERAEEDAAAHRRLHADGWRAYNLAITAENARRAHAERHVAGGV